MSEEIRNLLPGVSRRTVIKGAALGAALIGVGGLSACATGGGGTEPTTAPGGAGSTSPDNPFGVDKAKPLDVVIFNGGYGDEYGTAHVALYNTWAGGEVAKMTSTVEIASTLQPRFAGGNPPDAIDNSGADQLPPGVLISQKQVADLQPLLDAPSIDDSAKKISDILLPGTFEIGAVEGKMYSLNYVFAMWGLWYSKSLFEEKGWAPAKTWDEFTALSEKIKAAGMAPFIHTGVHTQYMANIIVSMAAKLGGPEVWLGTDNLEPDAWTNDSMMASATAWSEYAKAGFIHKDAEGIDHTTSQTQWLQGDAAFIPVGSWVENEMKGKVPDGFDMVVTPLPSLTPSDKLPFETINGGAGEPFIVPEAAANKAGGMEYLRIMLSQAATSKFAELTGSLCAVKGAGDKLVDPSTALQSVADATSAAGDNIINFNYAGWYSGLQEGQKDPVRNLLTGKITAEQFCTTMQKVSDDVAKDPKVTKYKRSA